MRVLFLLAFFAALAFAKPNREPPRPPPAKDPPAWKCQFGTVTRTGKNVKIEGNESWVAEGHIRPDGKLLVVWTRLNETLDTAGGLYSWRKDRWMGCWGWSHSVEIDEAGELKGETRDETLYPVGADK